METGRADSPLHRGSTGALRVADRAVSLLCVFDVRGGQSARRPVRPHDQQTPESLEQVRREAAEARVDSLEELADLQAERRRLVVAGQPTAAIDKDIADQRLGMDVQESVLRSLGAEPPPAGSRDGSAARRQAQATDAARRQVDVEVVDTLTSGGWFDDAYQKAKENPKLLFYKLQTNAYKFSWALIPISVPFVWLLFLHRRRYRQYGAYDHTVFVTYSLAFMSLGWVVLILLDRLPIPNNLLGLLLVLVPPVHIYRQLRDAYQLSRGSAAWRTVALLVCATLSTTIFAGLLLLMGVLG
jgi:hypothetical protein